MPSTLYLTDGGTGKTTLNLIKLQAGTNVTFSEVGDTVSVNATGGGGGDMFKSAYDPNDDGVIAAAQLDLSSKADTGHNHAGTYEPANANIQTHVTAAHAPSTAQANADITKAEIEAKLTGAISSHSHAGGSEAFPIGSVFLSVVSTNPATLLGYGTWTAIAAGKMLVGLDSGDTDFDTAEETGGAKTKTIAQANLPNISTGAGTSHNHTQDAHNHDFLPRTATTGSVSSIVTGTLDTSSTISGANQPHNQSKVATNQAEAAHTHSLGGSGTALNVVNPYFVVRIWRRDS